MSLLGHGGEWCCTIFVRIAAVDVVPLQQQLHNSLLRLIDGLEERCLIIFVGSFRVDIESFK